MTDLAAQIRGIIAQLRSPVAIIEVPGPLSEAEYADLVVRFHQAAQSPKEMKVIPRSLVDRMGDAVLAVLDATDPETYPPNYCECGKCLKKWLRELIADALGLEAGKETPDD